MSTTFENSWPCSFYRGAVRTVGRVGDFATFRFTPNRTRNLPDEMIDDITARWGNNKAMHVYATIGV